MRYNRDATWTCCPSKKRRREGGQVRRGTRRLRRCLWEFMPALIHRQQQPVVRGGFQRKIRSFVIVLCSRLTAANNEAGDNKAGTIMTARREGPITLIVIFETRIPIVMHWKIASSPPPPPLAKCWRNTKGKGGRKGEVSFFLTRFACVFFSNLIFRPSDIQPRRSFHGYIDREWIKYFFLMIHGHEDVSTKSN